MITIPIKDEEFHTVQGVITGTANDNRTAWRLDGAWLDKRLLPAQAQWEDAWEEYRNPSTRTPLIIFAKMKARKEYEPLLRLLVKNLRCNTRVTENDLHLMGIVPYPSTRKRVPPPESYPAFSTDSSIIRRLSVHFRDVGSASKAKPIGIHGAEIRWEIRQASPVTPADLINSSFCTRSPLTLEFDEDRRGETVWFCLRWENTRGEKGPWSELGSAVIP
ncbi:MAG: hypothetical protein LBR08_03285 [Bacteroidales bacterium]|jgi:hypothetical protein|nr:hypothetical protein [Bacteroidales bacterium]